MISIGNTEHLGIGGESFEPVLEKDGVYSFIGSEALDFGFQQACANIVIMGEDGEVGRLSWDEGYLAFSGDMAESAQIFFDSFLKPFVDEYMQAQGNPVPPSV